MFEALDDPRPTVQGTSCYVLENFCDGIQPETLRPYLPALLQRLGVLLQSTNQTTQEMAMSALAATAVAAEIDFLPYTEVKEIYDESLSIWFNIIIIEIVVFYDSTRRLMKALL